jgi:hypothetical protein
MLHMPAPAVRKIDPWPPLLSFVDAWYVDERIAEKFAFYSNYAETLVDWCKVYNHVVKLRVHKKSCSKLMIMWKAAGTDVINIARKGLLSQFIPPCFLDCGYCYLVTPELINRNKKASWFVQ